MARNQMRNVESYKIGRSQVNEFEYQKNKGQLTEQFEHPSDETAEGAKPMTPAERVKAKIIAAHEKVAKKQKKEAAKGGKSRPTTLSASSKDSAKMTLARKTKAKKSSKKR